MITSDFVLMLNERNLCTWYILPLIGLNPSYFVDANFINSYMVRGQMKIAVEVADVEFCQNLLSIGCFDKVVEGKHHPLMVFNIHPDWKPDVELFIQGKYSLLSDEAKTCIIQGSGLTYQQFDGEHSYTSSILLALDKSPKLREVWKQELDVEGEHLPDELLSIPAESCFIEL